MFPKRLERSARTPRAVALPADRHICDKHDHETSRSHYQDASSSESSSESTSIVSLPSQPSSYELLVEKELQQAQRQLVSGASRPPSPTPSELADEAEAKAFVEQSANATRVADGLSSKIDKLVEEITQAADEGEFRNTALPIGLWAPRSPPTPTIDWMKAKPKDDKPLLPKPKRQESKPSIDSPVDVATVQPAAAKPAPGISSMGTQTDTQEAAEPPTKSYASAGTQAEASRPAPIMKQGAATQTTAPIKTPREPAPPPKQQRAQEWQTLWSFDWKASW
jgi:hypothetical protein